MKTRELDTFESWLSRVNTLTLTHHFMSIYELYDDIPREVLETAYKRGETPQLFVRRQVTPIFWPDTEPDPKSPPRRSR